MSDTRKFTNLIAKGIDEGELLAAPLLKELLCYLSEDDVRKFYVDTDLDLACE
jgi:hypothetical protein